MLHLFIFFSSPSISFCDGEKLTSELSKYMNFQGKGERQALVN